MGATLKRNRNGAGAIATIDLTAAAAASRRFEVSATDGLDRSARLLGFKWSKSTSQVVTVTVSLIDAEDSDREYIIEGPTSDGGATTGAWYPPDGTEEVVGMETGRPSASPPKYRLQFSQAGGACALSPIAIYKGV